MSGKLIDVHPNKARRSKDLNGLTVLDAIKITAKGYKFTTSLKKALWLSHDKKCCYCGEEIETHMDMHVDHFEPRSKILEETIENLVCSCKRCNLVKRDRDVEDFRFCLAVSTSKLNGVILPNIARKLIDIGVDLPIKIESFYFEKIINGEIK